MQSKKTNLGRNTEPSNTPLVQHENLDKMIAYFSVNDLSIEELDLSVRTYKCLTKNKINTVSQLLTLTNKMLEDMQLGSFARKEIAESIQNLFDSTDPSELSYSISNTSEDDINIQSAKEKQLTSEHIKEYKGIDLLRQEKFRGLILKWFEKQHIMIKSCGLSTRSTNALLQANISELAQLLEKYPGNIMSLPNVGARSANEINKLVEEQLEQHRDRYIAFIIKGGIEIFDIIEIRRLILDIYEDAHFYGFSFEEYREKLPENISDEDIRSAVNSLLEDGSLEYADFRYYRVYPKFYDYALSTPNTLVKDNHLKILKARLDGQTLQEIADDAGFTRPNIRNIVLYAVQKIIIRRAFPCFDDDRYKYLFENYHLPLEAWLKYLNCSQHTFIYLSIRYKEGENPSVEEALHDKNISVNQKLCLQNYLDRNKICIDGNMIDKDRDMIEDYLLKTYCRDELTFDEFYELYNNTLDKAGVSADDDIRYTPKMIKYLIGKIASRQHVLWKYGQKIRYYNIDSYDFSELLDTLWLAQYKNIKLSTYKWIVEYPELMEKYDIRDQYELHTILKKIIDTDDYPNIKFSRQPMIKFGECERFDMIKNVIDELSPVDTNTLIKELRQRFGYSEEFIRANCLSACSSLCQNGIYTADTKPYADSTLTSFASALTEDFYSFGQLKDIYKSMYPEKDPEVINPLSLKLIGFSVNNGYAIRNFRSADEYFRYILTKDDITDIKALRQKHASGYKTLSVVLHNLCCDYELIYLKPGQTLNIRHLIKLGFDKTHIRDYCDKAIEYIKDNEFYSVKYLRQLGFAHELDSITLDDYFYNSLLSMDNRLIPMRISGTIVLRLRTERRAVSRRDFILSLICDQVSISIKDVMKKGYQIYGVNITDKYLIINTAADSGMYYDSTTKKLYRDKSYYYKELEKAEAADC